MVLDTLKLIVSLSPDATREAIGAIKAQQAQSPLATRRAARAAALALADPAAYWTEKERAQLAALLAPGPSGPRSVELRFRVTEAEKADVQARAAEVGLNVSDFIRQAIGLPGED